MQEGVQTLEFNSNVAVLERCNKIINSINEARYQVTIFDEYGNPSSTPEEIMTHLVCLYKEICVELTDPEDKVWEGKIKPLRNQIRVNPPNPRIEGQAYWKTTLSDIDDLDIKLRRLAKKHGFLSKNKDDPRVAALKR